MNGIKTTGNGERPMSTPKCLEKGRIGLVVPIVDFNRCEEKTPVSPCALTMFSRFERSTVLTIVSSPLSERSKAAFMGEWSRIRLMPISAVPAVSV